MAENIFLYGSVGFVVFCLIYIVVGVLSGARVIDEHDNDESDEHGQAF